MNSENKYRQESIPNMPNSVLTPSTSISLRYIPNACHGTIHLNHYIQIEHMPNTAHKLTGVNWRLNTFYLLCILTVFKCLLEVRKSFAAVVDISPCPET
jgi:hypothetical protein